MAKWEYLTVSLKPDLKTDAFGDFHVVLDEHGAAGWELVAIDLAPSDQEARRCVFKRPKTGARGLLN